MLLNSNLVPVITVQPQNQTVISGSTAVFSITASGYAPLKYNWLYGPTNWWCTNIVWATNNPLTLTNVQWSQAGYYCVQVYNDFGSVVSSNAVLTVTGIPPSIQTQPTNQAVLGNGTATFNVTATGSLPLHYQWSFNGTDLDRATNASLVLPNVNTNNAGNYTVVITNFAGSVTSSNAILSVYASAAATLGGYSFSGDTGFQFQVAGVPGFNYAVQESTNLFDWVSLITNTSPFIFVDANAVNFPQQFYRTLYVP